MVRILTALIPLLLISACNNDNKQNTVISGAAFEGRVINSCGELDGPVVRLQFTPDTTDCEAAVFLDVTSVDLDIDNTADIAVGMQLEPVSLSSGVPASAYHCVDGEGECSDVGELSINIDGQEGNQLLGTYHLKKNGKTTEGPFTIVRCLNERGMCG